MKGGHDDLVDASGVDLAELPIGAYAYPGPLRERLVAAIVSGEKTSTASLLEDYQRSGEPLPQVGDLEVIVDSESQPVCVTRNIRVDVERFAEVPDAHAVAEGEGCVDAAAWRQVHREFWTSAEFVAEVGEPAIAINDDAWVVLVTFEVVVRVS